MVDQFAQKRLAMVENQIKRRGISDPHVLDALRKVPRHRFVPQEARSEAYADRALRIAGGQTISQPYIVALMTELLALSGDARVLEIGTGSGYQAAILAELTDEAHTMERLPSLAQNAQGRLNKLGYSDVFVHHGDGTMGYPPAAPYDGILVAAAAPETPPALKEQLAPGGRLVIPTGSRYSQRLVVWTRKAKGFEKTVHIPVVCVPLLGEAGWPEK